MLKFPRDLYSDVRVEDVAETTLVLEDGELKQCTESRRRGAFVRVYDGKRWYKPSVATLCDLCNALETSADNILAAYIHADSAIRWSPLAEQLQALSPKKQEQVERMLACLLEIL